MSEADLLAHSAGISAAVLLAHSIGIASCYSCNCFARVNGINRQLQ